jgi:hypothetical protein
MASWTFVAALSWLMVATIGFVVSIIFLLTLVLAEFAVLVGVAAVAIPFLFAQNILSGSATAGAFAALYSFALAVYVLSEFGPAKAMLVLFWLAIASALAAREASKSPHLYPT